MRRFVATPFGLAVVGLLVLAGWAVWSAGIFDNAMQRQIRTSSVYTAPGIDLNRSEAEQIIGNRRLVVVFLDRGADLAEACDDTEDAAAGTFVLLLSPAGDELDHYGCSNFTDDDIENDENFGKAFVSEQMLPQGAAEFVDRPLDALKVAVVNYDTLVKTGTLPDGARTITSSASRYVLAAAAIAAVLAGAAAVFLTARRIGRLAATRREDRDTADDARATLNANVAVLAGHIIELDRRYARAGKKFQRQHRNLAAEYTDLVADLTAAEPDPALAGRVESLTERARALTGGPKGRRGKSA